MTLEAPFDSTFQHPTTPEVEELRPEKAGILAHFPVGAVSRQAEAESWRKELHRPLPYLHKWWARRLGCVFRALLQETARQSSSQNPGSFTVFDPFMGSGTTIYEAADLGFKAIGRDINPVAYQLTRAALEEYDTAHVRATFRHLTETVGDELAALYQTRDQEGILVDVLYYFWVKVVACPTCQNDVPLFKSRIFAKHAYPHKHPAHTACPQCGEVGCCAASATEARCSACEHPYSPQIGNVKGARVHCPCCDSEFTILDAVRASSRRAATTAATTPGELNSENEEPPRHRLYARLVLHPDGRKEFQRTTCVDEEGYEGAQARLEELWPALAPFIPDEGITDGHNTRQILNYNYRQWRQMFNARQLLALGLLARAIAHIADPKLRALFACLFSGSLEFNNLFASFKGVGTGAVRHLFSHHVLKPELMPIEANVWGTPKSSGAFSTLYQSRVERALAFKKSKNGRLSPPLVGTPEKFQTTPRAVWLSCGDSACTDVDSHSVDAVVTDPPFFDNVHYSELADFFHVWLRRLLPENACFDAPSTRSGGEVQDVGVNDFADKLAGVWRECARVLKPQGLLVFTYHHSKVEGWSSLERSLRGAGFVLKRAYPVKAEMSGSVPLSQAKAPLNYDLIFVAQHQTCESIAPQGVPKGWRPPPHCAEVEDFLCDLRTHGLTPSVADIKMMLLGTALTNASQRDQSPYSTDWASIFEWANAQSQRLFATSRAPEAILPPVPTPDRSASGETRPLQGSLFA